MSENVSTVLFDGYFRQCENNILNRSIPNIVRHCIKRIYNFLPIIDKCTGWIIDPKTCRPIDPQTQQPVSKNVYKKMKKIHEKRQKKLHKQAKKILKLKRMLQDATVILQHPFDKLSLSSMNLVFKMYLRFYKKYTQNNYIPIEIMAHIKAFCVPQHIKVNVAEKYMNKYVEFRGWAHYIRKQAKILFIELRDGTGFPPRIQCVLYGDLINTKEAILLNREASMIVRGCIVPRKPNKHDQRKCELNVDSFQVIDSCEIINEPPLPTISNCFGRNGLRFRHLMLRTERMSLMLRLRCYITQEFRNYFHEKYFIEVTPPKLTTVKSIDCCGTPFMLNDFDYFNDFVYLTQSSKMYLETCVPSLSNVFCIGSLYDQCNTKGRYHSAEEIHIEAEMSFVTDCTELMAFMEDLIVTVCSNIASKYEDLLDYVRRLNHEVDEYYREKNSYVAWKFGNESFVCMSYKQAIDYMNNVGIQYVWCNSYGKLCERQYKYDDCTSKNDEMRLVNMIGKALWLTGKESEGLHESQDDNKIVLLLPNIGTALVCGIGDNNYEQLINYYKCRDIDPATYYWYNDLKKYQHGMQSAGFNLNLELFLCWMFNIHHIKEVSLYPRYLGRCSP